MPAYRIYIIVVMVVLLPHVMLWRHRDPIESIARTIGTTTLALAVIHDNLVGFRLLPWRLSFEVFGIGPAIRCETWISRARDDGCRPPKPVFSNSSRGIAESALLEPCLLSRHKRDDEEDQDPRASPG